ncbi:MAG: hypothetical protein ACRYG6_02865 [Janthinobacterium lividum]
MIHGLVFRLMGRLALGQGAVLVCTALAGPPAWARARDRRGW